jgi:hypothetical protein
VNETYKTILKKVGEREWHELRSDTSEIVWQLEERTRNELFVELFLKERRQILRVYSDRITMVEDSGSKDVAFGHWRQAINNRMAWNSVSYNGVLVKQGDDKWIETDNRTGKVKVIMEHRAETSEFIEMYNPDHKELVRLYNDRMETFANGTWQRIGVGNWIEYGIDKSKSTLPKVSMKIEGDSSNSKSGKASLEKTSAEGLGVTLEAYYKIRPKMTYSEIYKIIGRHGVEASSASFMGESIHVIQWEEGFFGGVMVITFENGRMLAKSQFGLKAKK